MNVANEHSKSVPLDCVLTLERVGNSTITSSPVSFGVPFRKGLIDSLEQVSLESEVGSLDSQWRSLMRWADGSIRWALCDSNVSSLASELRVSFGESDAEHVASSVAEGSRNTLDRSMFWSDVNTADILACSDLRMSLDVEFRESQVAHANVDHRELLHEGHLVSTASVSGCVADPENQGDLDWHSTIQRFSDSSLIRVQLTIVNPKAAEHPGGVWELGDENSCLLDSVKLRMSWAERDESNSTVASWRDAGGTEWCRSELPFSVSQLGSGGARFQSKIHRDRSGNVPVKENGYRIRSGEQSSEGKRITPVVVSSRESRSAIGVYAERFWQNFPISINATSDGIEVVLLEGRNGPQELQPGEQKTIELWFSYGDEKVVQQELASVVERPIISVDPEWVCQSRVVPWLTPKSQEVDSTYLDLVEAAIEGDDSFFQKREKIDQYGWRHFGDVYGDHEAIHSEPTDPLVSQYNNQYDMVLGLGLNFIRGGSSRWLELMQDLARHTIDIDIYHTDADKASYNHGMFWHTVHYIDAGKSTHRTYPKGSCGGGPSSGHAYARGLLLHYCMTGDGTAKEAVTKMGDWMIASEDGSQTKYRWLAKGDTGLTSASGTEDYHGPGRGPGNCVEVLTTAFELTHERKYLEHAEKIIRRVVHPNQDIESLDLLDAENKWFYNLFLQALGRYLEVKISMNEYDRMYSYGQQVLLNFVDWTAEHEYPYLDKRELLEFPTETWAAQEMRKVEVFQWAARHATGQRREKFLERAEFFFKTSIRQLNEFETRSLCRPIALLLTNGYSRAWFANGGLEGIEAAPAGGDFDFGQPANFHSQKTRAIRRAKAGVMAGASIFFLGMIVGTWWLLTA